MNQRPSFKGGRGDRTRTCDSLVPNQERYQLRYTSFLRRFFLKSAAKVHIFCDPCKLSAIYFGIYLIIPCSTKIFFSAITERSTCSSVCVAIRA